MFSLLSPLTVRTLLIRLLFLLLYALPGVLNQTLRNFLTTALPAKKKNKFVLGVSEDKIGSAIQEELGFTCQRNTITQELLRGVRLHFPAFLKGMR